ELLATCGPERGSSLADYHHLQPFRTPPPRPSLRRAGQGPAQPGVSFTLDAVGGHAALGLSPPFLLPPPSLSDRRSSRPPGDATSRRCSRPLRRGREASRHKRHPARCCLWRRR